MSSSGLVHPSRHPVRTTRKATGLSAVALLAVLGTSVPAQAATAVAKPRPAAVLYAGSTATTPAAPATSAAAFVDSVGVNVHMGYDDTSYGDRDRLVRLVTELGVQHVRDGLQVGRADVTDTAQRLARAGVLTDWIVGDPQYRWGNPTPTQAVALLSGPLVGTVSSVEGANEYDCSGDRDWVSRTHAFQAEIASRLDAVPSLRDLPLLGPSFCRADSKAAYGAEPAADLGNMHPYPGGGLPEAGIGAEIAGTRANSGSKPQIATETGYHNALATTSGHRAVTEQVAAGQLLRIFLENYRLGVQRTYSYELLDQRAESRLLDPEEHFGLVRADGTPKPAYHALRNLLDVVQDTGTARSDGPSAQLQGAPATARQLLLPRSDGSTDLVVWNAAASGTPAAPVRVAAPQAVIASVAAPVAGTAFSPLGTGTSLPLSLTTEPQVVRLKAAPVPQTPVAPVATTPVVTGPVVNGLGTCMDVEGARTALATPVQSWACHGGANQAWTYDGKTLRTSTGLCLDVTGASTAPGAALMTYTCHGGDNQRFTLTDGQLRTPAGLCVDVWQASAANGARVLTWTCHTGPNQRWRVAGTGA